MKKIIIINVFILLTLPAQAVEQKIRGLVDLRYTLTDGVDSYLVGDYGKLRYNDGNQLSLAQGAINYQLNWKNMLSIHLIANGYADGVKDGIGLTESYVQYKGLPSENGLRFRVRGGLMFPNVSMTNFLTGWSSPYTLSYSTINSWLAQELRHQGLEFSVTRLGRLSGNDHDFEFTVAAFQANDPAGAQLAWYGWTVSSRQTLRQEVQALPNSHIGFVPENSDMFSELDHRTGFHVSTQWTWHDNGRILLGYYDNQADPKIVNNLQWAWRTRFFHLGGKWQLAGGLELIAQYLVGDTLMQSSYGSTNLVKNEYDSGFLMISKTISQHRISGRIEKFSVTDNDVFTFDNNNEDGDAITLNYNYRLNKHLFFHAEYNWLDSNRPSRLGKGHPENLLERQVQLGVRYFF